MRFVSANLTFVCTLALASSGCAGAIQSMAANQTVGVLSVGAKSLFEETDYLLAGDAMPANLKTMEALGVLAKDNAQLDQILSQAYCGYAFGWLEPDWMADPRPEFDEGREKLRLRVMKTYARGRQYGIQGLDIRHKGFAESTGNLPKFLEMLKELDEDDLPYSLWAGYCWAQELQHKLDDMNALADLPFIRALLQRTEEIDPNYYWGTATTILGSMETAVPESFGGKPEEGKRKFEAALKSGNRAYLNTQAAYAQFYATAVGDRELYEKLLKEVLEADDVVLPPANLDNQVAKRRAQVLLDLADKNF
jgi:TRAP transporter T-component